MRAKLDWIAYFRSKLVIGEIISSSIHEYQWTLSEHRRLFYMFYIPWELESPMGDQEICFYLWKRIENPKRFVSYRPNKSSHFLRQMGCCFSYLISCFIAININWMIFGSLWWESICSRRLFKLEASSRSQSFVFSFTILTLLKKKTPCSRRYRKNKCLCLYIVHIVTFFIHPRRSKHRSKPNTHRRVSKCI